MTVSSNMILAPSSIKKGYWKGKSRWQKAGIILIVVFVSLFASNLINRGIHYHPVSGIAEKRNTNGQEYWHIEADNHYDLGYLTGKSLWREIWELKQILWLLAPSFDISYQTISKESQRFLPEIPETYQNEFQGMADGAAFASGLPITFNDILIQNAWFDAFYGQILPSQQGPVGCSAIAGITQENYTIGGQNFDFNVPFQKALSFVSHKIKEGPSIFSLRLGGSLSMPMAITSAGLMILVTLVQQNLKAAISMPILCKTRQMLEECNNIEEAKNLILENTEMGATLGYNLLILDKTNFIAIEASPMGYITNYSAWAVKTNTYQTQMWQDYLVDPEYSKDRQEFLSNLMADEFREGNESQESIQKILTISSEICREGESSNDVATLAHMSWNNFCLGNPCEKGLGKIPFLV